MIALAFKVVGDGAELLRDKTNRQFTVLEHYRREWPSWYWYHLDRLEQLPDDLVVATTEVGRPGVLLPRKRIIDLAGLNDTRIGRHGLDWSSLLRVERPDVLYVLRGDYADLRRGLLGNFDYIDNYEAISVPSPMFVALRRQSHHYEALCRAFDR